MSIVDKGKTAAGAASGQPRWLKSIELVAVGALLVWLFTGPLAWGGGEKAKSSFERPGEFLYLDGARVLGYLAQFDGGTFTSKQLTSKSSDTVNNKLSVEGALELGENSEQEESVSKQITPTAAGNYVELLSKLDGLGALDKIGLGRFQGEVSKLAEGQFVVFQTHGLRSPTYLNPYLAVRQRETLSTLFPMPVGEPSGREQVLLQRIRARRFRKQVGEDPRVVFALRPLNTKEIMEAKEGNPAESEATAEASGVGGGVAGRRPVSGMTKKEREARKREAIREQEEEENHVQYLMPMDAQLLTRERSLIKFGGGDFTVVGKVVRIFPENGDHNDPAYVDSPTVETWAQPLASAPLQLLCRADRKCVARLEKGGLTRAQRKEVAERSREAAIEALEDQTVIYKRGAVILPIAIYK